MTQQTLQYVINANVAGFVSAIGQAEAKYSQALQGMSDKASRIQLFEKTQESAKQAAQEFFKLKEQTASYQLALAGARAPLQQFQQAMAAVELTTRQSAVEVGHQRSALKPLEEALKTATSAYTSIRKEAIQAGGTAEDFAGEIAQAKRQLDSATTALSQHKAAMEKSASEYTANKEALAAYKSQLATVTKPVKDLENQLATAERQLVQTELKMRA
ncbi:hypothetical protein [Paludibacterium denitrificans]|uniref:Phage tail tape measure protein n=1 Tax=Paludibacterium denitrificans TaxID=2675226 RepID=A0A844G9Q3_9NEIS|nr:hypothetical protein [Paludibacterium denitrificans]MTD32512.1 hypothetical protein [Paludibacterium denitrificans]